MNLISHDFARHVLRRRSESIGAAARDEMRVLLRDYLGVALGGSTTEAARIAARYQLTYAACPVEATILGERRRVAAPAAAFANGVSAHSLDMDDTDERSMMHMSAPVVSAALACAEAGGNGGADFIAAIRAGCDIMQAISDAANPGMRDRGFHSTAVCGVFGATATAGLLLGLGHDEMVSAFGAAGAHAAGMFEIYGPSMQKSLHPGPAAQNGIVSARLAKLGFRGAETIFDGKAGLFTAFTGAAEPEAARARLADDGPIGVEYKPYSCFRPIHTAIDCALDLRSQVGSTEEIVAIRITRHPFWAAYHIVPAPRTEQEAKGSLNYGIAVALVRGGALPDQYSRQAMDDREVVRLSGLLAVSVDETLPRGDSCRLEVVLGDGHVLARQADYPRGSRQRPLAEAEHEAKFRSLTDPLLSADRATKVLQAVAGIDTAASLDELLNALGPAESSP